MKDTAISSPIRATNTANGTSVRIAVTIPAVNSCPRKVERIFSRVWPATKLEKRRTPSDTERARYEISSIITRAGTRTRGVPDGTK